MTGLDAGVVGEWLAEADDAPIPIPWRGKVYSAPPPDGSRGKRIAALLALSRGEKKAAEDEAPAEGAEAAEADDDGTAEAILQGEPIEVLALGRETYDQLVDAGMRPDGKAMKRISTLCLIRWGYGSDDIARGYLARATAADKPEPETPKAPKSRARSGPKTSRSTGSANGTRSRAGSRTTSSPKE